MIKIWTNYDDGDKIIAYVDGKIYKANPAKEDIDSTVSNMQLNDFSGKKTLGIPLSYLKAVRLQEGKEYIQVFFGKESEEHLIIKDKQKREEIFDYLKNNIPNTVYSKEEYSAFKAGKKPLIGLAVLSVLFIYTLYLAIGIAAGDVYEAHGRVGLVGILIGIAGLGILKVILIFGTLIGIVVTSAFLKMRKPPVVQLFTVTR